MKIPSGRIIYRPGSRQDDTGNWKNENIDRTFSIFSQESGVFFVRIREVGEGYDAAPLFGGSALNLS